MNRRLRIGIVSSETLRRTGSFSARTNLDAQAGFDKQHARDMLRAVSEGQKARNTGATTMKKPSARAKESASIRRSAKRAVKKSRKAAKAPRSKKAAASGARTPVAGGKVDVVQLVADMMARPVGHKDAPLGGASMDEMVKASGYDAHQMRAKIKLVRDRLGYATTAPSKENGRRYFAKPKAGG